VRRTLKRAFSLAVAAGIVAVGAPRAAAQIFNAEYAARRAALAASLDSGVVVAFGGAEPTAYWPTFHQLPAFYYFSGFGETNAVLLMVKRGAATDWTMYVPTRSAIQERWVGARTRPGDMNARIGIPGRDIAGLDSAVDSLASGGLPFYIIPDVETADYAEEDSLTRGARFLAKLRLANPWLETHSLDSTVRRLRAKKSPAEIALLRKATEISVRAHTQAMKATAPDCGEYEIQALLEGTFRRFGGDRPGYGSIVGSGPNATILHYMEDSRVMRDGELLLIDAATSFAHYSADVTRTVPVNGRFTPAQRDIYQIVLDAQDAFVRQVKPGVSVEVASDSGQAVVAKGLMRLGLVESAEATFDPPPGATCPPEGCLQLRVFALHGYGGHGIGLEVHDPAQYYAADGKFGVGDVFTVEPGIYVSPDLLNSLPDTPKNRAFLAKIRPAAKKYSGIGVRIEDDYALTEKGLEWLSQGSPREIARIEELMRGREIDLPGGGACGRLKT
jgi:Xaa-Pro aminopeptidase